MLQLHLVRITQEQLDGILVAQMVLLREEMLIQVNIINFLSQLGQDLQFQIPHFLLVLVEVELVQEDFNGDGM